MTSLAENDAYLREQLITCLGNKRALLDFIGGGVALAQKRLGREKLRFFDVFSGSGIAARYFKRFASFVAANDLERYSAVINKCYLSNLSDLDMKCLRELHAAILHECDTAPRRGIIAELYAPRDDKNIRRGERVFYTARNAAYIDTARMAIEDIVPEMWRHFFIAPLLSEASIHANTSGVFKGFYKNPETGAGRFGGKNEDALARIKGGIALPFPVFSNFETETLVLNGDANEVAAAVPEVDVAYLDPPYNQHPYGSNYFMLNLIADYQRPENISPVSGIPAGWNRSAYNKGKCSGDALRAAAENVKAKILLISFNSEGFIKPEEMIGMLKKIGKTKILETTYNTFRGSRNLRGRAIHVKEYLYFVEK